MLATKVRHGDVAAALANSGPWPSRLHLELTESVFASERSHVIAEYVQGVKVSLDDFGAGYSCLADLQHLPVDQIKIDKSFRNIGTDAEAIIRLIVAAAQTFALDVVAEGAETEAQADWLRSLHVQDLQGLPVLSTSVTWSSSRAAGRSSSAAE